MIRYVLSKEYINSLTSLWQALDNKYDSKRIIFSLVLILLLCTNYLLFGMTKITQNRNPEAYDTVAYLGEANLIKNNGGIKNFLNLCITGKYRQDNQNPLYILLLSPFASRDISFYINAKITSFLIGLILLVFLFIIARNKWGDLCASLAVLGLLFNAKFLIWASMVGCETLLMLMTLLCMHFVLRGFENPKYWSVAGIFAGLAYLAKGTGLFLIPSFAVSALIAHRLKAFRNKHVWSFFILFTLTASPLFVRNIVLYKNPLYNVNTHKMSYTVNELTESNYLIFNPDIGVNVQFWPEREINNAVLKPSLDLLSILHRLFNKIVNGIWVETKIFLNLLCISPINWLLTKWPLYYLPSQPCKLIFGLLLLCLFLIGLAREKKVAAKVYILTTLFTFLIGLTLFSPIYRYLLPIIPLVWIYVALGILTFLDMLRKKSPSIFTVFNRPFLFPTLLIFGCFILISLHYPFNKYSISTIVKSVDYSDSRRDLLNWLRSNLNEDDKYIEGPNFNWQLEKGTWFIAPINKRKSIEEFNSFIKQHDITYIVIDWYSLTVSRYRGENLDKRKKLDGYFNLDSKKGIVQQKSVDGWRLVYKDHRPKVEFMVFKAT